VAAPRANTASARCPSTASSRALGDSITSTAMEWPEDCWKDRNTGNSGDGSACPPTGTPNLAIPAGENVVMSVRDDDEMTTHFIVAVVATALERRCQGHEGGHSRAGARGCAAVGPVAGVARRSACPADALAVTTQSTLTPTASAPELAHSGIAHAATSDTLKTYATSRTDGHNHVVVRCRRRRNWHGLN
jgi:hypothetical protein